MKKNGKNLLHILRCIYLSLRAAACCPNTFLFIGRSFLTVNIGNYSFRSNAKNSVGSVTLLTNQIVLLCGKFI